MTILRVFSSGMLLLTMGVTIYAANSRDKIHVKIHVPEIVKKHVHTRTIYKHHYHKVPMHHHKMPPPPPPHHMGHASHLEPVFNLAPIHPPIFNPGPGVSAADNVDVKVPWLPKFPPPIIPVAPLPPKEEPPFVSTELKGTYSHTIMDDSYELESDEQLKNNDPEFDAYKPLYSHSYGTYKDPNHSTGVSISHGQTGVRDPENDFSTPKYTTPMSMTSTSYSHQLHYFPSAGEEDVAIPVKTKSKHPVWYMSPSGEHGQKLQPAKAMESDDFSHFDNILTTKPKSVITKYGAKVPLKELGEIRRRVRKQKSSKRSK